MPNEELPKLLGVPNLTELEHLAGWFHQDYAFNRFGIMEGGKIYIDSLPHERRTTLGNELREFIQKFGDHEPDSVLEAWIDLGVAYWDRQYEVLSTLNEFIQMLQGEPGEFTSQIKGAVHIPKHYQ